MSGIYEEGENSEKSWKFYKIVAPQPLALFDWRLMLLF